MCLEPFLHGNRKSYYTIIFGKKVRGIFYQKKKNNSEKKEKEENEKILIYFIFTKLVPAPFAQQSSN
jgi:hypothetical protein